MAAGAGGALPSERPSDHPCGPIGKPRAGSLGGLTLPVLTPQPAKERWAGARDCRRRCALLACDVPQLAEIDTPQSLDAAGTKWPQNET